MKMPITDGEKLRLLAALEDARDCSRSGKRSTEVQDDLRRMADRLDALDELTATT
jgi:hypothetical protein